MTTATTTTTAYSANNYPHAAIDLLIGDFDLAITHLYKVSSVNTAFQYKLDIKLLLISFQWAILG